jgi:coenzyme F420-reducing hydrogenase alpha subunit
MSIQAEDAVSFISIPVDAETLRRLTSIADMCHADPKTVAASLLRDVLADDEAAHGAEFELELMPPAGSA